VADGAQVHVVVEVVGDEEAVGDAVDEVRRERGPAALRHGLRLRSHHRKGWRIIGGWGWVWQWN
jgi:hypothetical protein